MNPFKSFSLQSRIAKKIKTLDAEIKASEIVKYELSRDPKNYIGAVNEINQKKAVVKTLKELL